jgi:hypothetical protein
MGLMTPTYNRAPIRRAPLEKVGVVWGYVKTCLGDWKCGFVNEKKFSSAPHFDYEIPQLSYACPPAPADLCVIIKQKKIDYDISNFCSP